MTLLLQMTDFKKSLYATLSSVESKIFLSEDFVPDNNVQDKPGSKDLKHSYKAQSRNRFYRKSYAAWSVLFGEMGVPCSHQVQQ